MWRSDQGGSQGRSANRSRSDAGRLADRLRVDPRHRHVCTETERQRVRDGVVPAGVGREQPCLRDHVAVEKYQHVVRRGARTGVSRPREPKPAPLLAHQPDVERGRGRDRQGRAGTVIDDHDLEQVPRVDLPLQPRECQRERLGRLETGHDDADRKGGRERRRLRQPHLAPVVVAHRGGTRCARGRSLTAVFRGHGHETGNPP